MSKQWWTPRWRDAVLRGCGTCGGLFLLAIADDRPECPVCGAAGSDSERLDREQFEAEAAALASQTEQAAAAAEMDVAS